MNYKIIFELLGGLGLVVYGMKIMSDGLQRSAGEKMKAILGKLTSNRVLGILVGAGVTALIQSSSATTVMLVGFVNAGLMNLTQAAGVIMGANIGTTITAQLIAFNLNDIAPLIVAIGAVIVIFTKKKKVKDIGQIILGIGLLFFGMATMETSMEPIAKTEAFKTVILHIGNNPILGVFVGLAMTSIVQASSATIGIIQAFAAIGAINLNVALPILFGDNIGTCATALLASIGSSKNGRRTAIMHLTFNVVGTVIFMACFRLVLKFIPMLGGNMQRQIANTHTIFNVTNTIIQAPLIPLLVAFSKKVIPGEDKLQEAKTLKFIDERLMKTPTIALQNVIKEINRMGNLAVDNLKTANDALTNGNEKLIGIVKQKEEVIDYLETGITSFMVELSNQSLSDHESKIIVSLLHVVNDIERIGDHASNISELAQYKIDHKIIFTDEAKSSLADIYNMAEDAAKYSVSSLINKDTDSAEKALKIEPQLDVKEKDLREQHIQRLSKGQCSPLGGTVYLDALSNFERVGDHSENIAQITMDLQE